MRVFALFATAAAFRGPVSRIARAPAVQAALDIDGVKNAVAPSEVGATSQAIYSWGGLALGPRPRPTALSATGRCQSAGR